MGKFEKQRPNQEEAELEQAFFEVTGEKKEHDGSTAEKAAASNNPRKTKIKIITICVITALILAAFAAGGWYYFCYTGDDGLILPNVHVAGIDLGGMTTDEAKNVLHLATDSSYTEKDMIIHLPGENIPLSPADTGVSLDVDAAVSAAYTYGRTGTPAEQRKARRTAQDQDYSLDLIPYLGLKDEYVQSVMKKLDIKYNTALTQPTVSISGKRPSLEADAIDANAAHQVLTITLGIPESSLDTKALYGMILDSYSENRFEITLNLKALQPEKPDLNAIFKEYCVSPADAVLNTNTYEIAPEKYGYGFDMEAVKLLVDHAEHGETLEIPLNYLTPKVTKKQIESTLFQDKLGSCETYQYSSPDRSTNLDLACEAINGLIIKPGDTFSFNEALGERTAEKGYKGAAAYVNGETVTSIGGGICQVSTALYYSALIADLEIVERYCHLYPSSYIDLGMDATVSWGAPDFQFRNNTKSPIRIEAYSSDGSVDVVIYGTDEKDYYVEMTYEVVDTYSPSVIYKEYPANNEEGYKDGDVIQSGITGYQVETYKNKYSKKTNELISSDYEAYSDYDKRDKIVCKIQVPETEPTKPSEPTPTTEPTVPSESGNSGAGT